MEAVVKGDIPAGGRIFKYTLSTGGRCYIIPKCQCSAGYAAVVVNAGSSDTHAVVGDEKMLFPLGTAHFLEHKIFEKENYECTAEFAKLGAYVNAFTDLSRTVYYFSARDNFDKALELLVKMVYSPYFTESTMDREKKIITREIAMYKDNAAWNVYFKMLHCLYNRKKRFKEVSGTESEIEKINSNTLYKFYNCFYTGKNISFVVCADVDPMRCAEIIENNVIKREENQAYFEYGENKKIKNHLCVNNGNFNMPVFNAGFRLEKLKADIKNLCAVEILFEMAAGKSSLYREKMLNRGVSSFTPVLSQCFGRGFYFASIEGRSNEGRKAAESLIKSFEQMLEKGIDGEKLAHTKKVMEERMLKSFKSAEDTMFQQAFVLRAKGDVFDKLTYIRTMDEEYLYEVLRRSFVKGNSVLSIM